MFKKIRNIETSFQSMRLVCILSVIGAFAFSGYVEHEAGEKLSRAESRIYILAFGKAVEALASDRKNNVAVEARDHVTVFHQDFFTLAPDEKVIAANTGKALYLADGSAKRMYDNLKESGYYANIISGNISQEIIVDSITLDMTTYPFYFRCYAMQRIIRTTSIATRDLITEGWLRSVSRSDNNPHGFLIERWNTIENKDIKIQTR